jgi:arylsulfatase A-like enzyme
MSQKPNIIYILGDDHRADFLGINGHPIINTPNIDYLANNGTSFSNTFCTSPTCTPSRCCHYLGQWERRHGVNFNSASAIAESAWENSFPMQLKKNGYFTGWVGKNHVPLGLRGYSSGAMEEAFDYWYGNHGHSGFYPKERSSGRIYRNAKMDTQVELFEEGAMNFLDPQKNFIESCPHPLPERPRDKPFCLCITFNLPHANGTGTMELRPEDDKLYKSTYRDRFNEFELPKTYIQFADIEEPKLPVNVYNGITLPSYDYVKWPTFLRERMVRICQTVTGMDYMIGRLCEKLEDMGIADNTIIIFSTDHGIHHGEHGLGGKNFLYEEDIRIPLVIYDPRLPNQNRGRKREELVVVPDLAPTVLEMTGCEVPRTMQGKSIVPLLNGSTTRWRDAIFTEALMDIQNYPRSESVRTDEWKYIRYFSRTEDPNQKGWFRGTLDNYNDCLNSSIFGKENPIYEELYNLKQDPYEEWNLSSNISHQTILDSMREKIEALGREIKVDQSPPATVDFN